MKRHSKLTIFLLTIFLTACIKTAEIDNSGIINAQGMDVSSEDKIKSTFVVFQFTAQSDSVTKVIKGKGETVEGSIEDAEHASMYRLLPGKLKLTLFGEDMAKKGIFPLIDTQARDTRVPDLMYLAVGQPTAEDILSVDEEELAIDPGQYLYDLIYNHTTDHNIPRKTIQDFLRIYYDVGQDNVLPIFKVKDKVPKQVGGAIFQGDKMVGDITNKEIIYVNLIQRTVRGQLLEVNLPIEPFESYLEGRQKGKSDILKVALIIQKGKSKVKLTDVGNLQFEANTTVVVNLIEQSGGLLLEKPEVIQILQDEVQKKIEKEMQVILDKLKGLQSDPYGFGLLYRETEEGKDMTDKEWHEKFPEIQVKFNIDVTLMQHGATD